MSENDRTLRRMYRRAFECAWLDGRNYVFHTGDVGYVSALQVVDEFIEHHAGAMTVRIEYSNGRWVFLIEEVSNGCTAGALLT